MHPAAAIEVRTHRRMRARVHVEPHPSMVELTALTFSDGEGTHFEVALNPENLEMLRTLLEKRSEEIAEFLAATQPRVKRITA